MKTHLALLRGINVGGNKKVPMADLRAFVEKLGFQGARTLLQSGNLVFRSDGQRTDAALETFLEEEAARILGLSTVFLIRTVEEWTEVITRNPFPGEAAKAPSHFIVMFLREQPTSEALQRLQTAVVGDERFQLVGRHLYAVFPDGIGESRLATAMMTPRFSPCATGRNWNTVLKLAELAKG